MKSIDLTSFSNINIIRKAIPDNKNNTESGTDTLASLIGEKSLNMVTESNLDVNLYKSLGKNVDSIKILESNDDLKEQTE
jgi:hypothetical protein